MAYRVEVSPKADAQLGELDSTVGSAVERKIIWLQKTPQSWFITGLSECLMTWRGCANYASGTGEFSTGSPVPIHRFNGSTIQRLKLVRCPRSLAPTLLALPSMPLIPFAPFSFAGFPEG
jgi:hypothetical protein